MTHLLRHGLLVISVAGIAGCTTPLGMTALGVGGSTAVSHTMNGITYKTFTAPSAKVKRAALMALNRMEIKVTSASKESRFETLNAATDNRTIQVQLEAVTANTTRMRVTARNGGLFYDSATATEIIMQTERLMGRNT